MGSWFGWNRPPPDPRPRFDRPVDVLPEIWLGTPPGTADWPALLEPSRWADVAADVDVLLLQHLSFLPEVTNPTLGPNVYQHVIDLQLVEACTAQGVRIGVEAPGLKEWSADPAVYVDQSARAVDAVKAWGGDVEALVLDEPFYAAKHICQPPVGFPEAGSGQF